MEEQAQCQLLSFLLGFEGEKTVSIWPISSHAQGVRPCEKRWRLVLLKESLPRKAPPLASHSFCGILQLKASPLNQGLSLSTADVRYEKPVLWGVSCALYVVT